jgi:hypothetical protein
MEHLVYYVAALMSRVEELFESLTNGPRVPCGTLTGPSGISCKGVSMEAMRPPGESDRGPKTGMAAIDRPSHHPYVRGHSPLSFKTSR